MPFREGEKLFYKVSYNWGIVWINAGKVEFSVETIHIDKSPFWHFQSSGRSLSGYDWIYKVRDSFESVADIKNFVPLQYKRQTLEGNYAANNRLYFFPDKNIVVAETENSAKKFTVDTIPYSPGIFDLQTAVYYARTIDFSILKPGDEIPLNVIIDGKIYNLSGSYYGEETVENHDGKIYKCHRFSATLVEGTIFKAGEKASIWVTADKNKIPVLVEAGILVGSVKAYFINGKNLKYPIEALLN